MCKKIEIKKNFTKRIKIGAQFIVIFFLFFSYTVQAQSGYKLDKRLDNLINNGVNFDSLKVVIRDIIYTKDTSYLRKQLKKIIRITSKNIDSKPYVYTLIGYGQLQNNNTIPYLNEAYDIAKKNAYDILLGHILNTKILIFKESTQNDSLLVSLMEAKDIYEKSNSEKQLVPILHATADLYYSVKLYDKAENVYLEIMAKKGDLSEWNFWRHSVILNNLGLIEMKRDNYVKALRYFNKSLKIIEKDSNSSRHSTALGYNALQLAKCYYKLNNINLAKRYYNQSLSNCLKNNMIDELTQLYNLKSEWLYSEGKIDSSLVYAKKSFKTFKKDSRYKQNLLSIYTSFYKIFKDLKQYKKAYNYLNLYSNFRDSLNNTSQSVRNIQILEENKYLKKAAKVNQLKTRNYALLAILIFSTIIITIIYTHYLKLNKAHLKLIDKSLEVAYADSPLIKQEFTSNVHHSGEFSVKENIEIINKLRRYIENDKVFLQKEISINDVAHQLNTNRTYLSRAINIVLKKSFTTYINDLRIKEAIRKISSKEFKQMTIEGISEEVGFNNRVSFNTAFKKYTGVLPSYFIKNLAGK